MYQVNPEQEKREILIRYRRLLKTWRQSFPVAHDTSKVRKAFRLATQLHSNMRRKSGEPYIYHPLEVARIVVGEIGLGETSIICALLHDVVEDAGYPLEDIQSAFGEKVAQIIDGLTKIKEISDNSNDPIQAINHRKILLTLSTDVRVILIKLGDRLHNMRTLEYMTREKQLKIAAETNFLYAPLAHRLGLYAVKSELEDLAMKHTQPEIYNDLFRKIQETHPERVKFIENFTAPVVLELKKRNINFEIISREKSIYSIWKKMQRKEIPFEEVYDIFAIRIIITPNETDFSGNDIYIEKDECLKAYNIVTRFYNPLPNRFRDWISTPKANGYEALHTTVMSNTGRWVEVQIRTRRMHEIAEKGYAAHWKYKDVIFAESGLDQWLDRIKEILQAPDDNALDFVENFKLYLYPEEIFVYTPKGDMKTLPSNATALDFAYSIHTDLGNSCIGAKINNKLVSLKHQLKSGDKVEILTSRIGKPKEEWLEFVITPRAKAKIKEFIREERKAMAIQGKKTLEELFKQIKMEFIKSNIIRFQEFNNLPSLLELYYKIAIGEIGLKELKNCCSEHDKSTIWLKYIRHPFGKQKGSVAPRNLVESMLEKIKEKPESHLLKGDLENIDYRISKCCNPIPGDEIIGLIEDDGIIYIHRANCQDAGEFMSHFGDCIVKAKWKQEGAISFLTGIKITGIDRIGFVNDITKIITEQLNINIRSLHFDSVDGVTEGAVMLYVYNTQNLQQLIRKIQKIKGITNVSRIN